MMQLAASILALGVGPTLDTCSRPGGPTRACLDAFTFVAMLGLILGSILPEAFEKVGWPSLVVATLACFGPTIFEQRIRSLAQEAHLSAILLGTVGLIVHGTFDGMALVDMGGNSGWNALAVGVILHRIPAGLTLWWIFRPMYGKFRACLILAGLAATTVAGYIGAESLHGRVTEFQEGLFMALVGGALLHVVMHRTGHAHDESMIMRRRHGAFLGTIFGFILLYLMSKTDAHGHAHDASPDEIAVAGDVHGANFLESFFDLALESAPALVIAFTMAGLIQVFLPKSSVKWMSKGGAFAQSLKGVGFGLPLPICSCGVVPVYRSLASRGVPVGAGLAFLIATPELGIDAVLLSLPLLGAEMMGARIIAAAFVAVLTAWFIARLKFDERDHEHDHHIEELETTEEGGFVGAFKVGWVRFFDSTAPWILLGLIVAAACQPLLPEGAFDSIPAWLQVPLFAVIGMPLYVCASGATPIVAVLLMKGVSPGAALAFLLTGPATNVTTFGLLKSIHGKKLALAFVGAIIVTTVTAGIVTNVVVGESVDHALHLDHEAKTEHVVGVDASDQNAAVSEHEHDSRDAELWELAALGILALGLLLSIHRQGPQGFTSHVFAQSHDHDDHDDGLSPGEGSSGCCGPPPEEKPSCCH